MHKHKKHIANYSHFSFSELHNHNIISFLPFIKSHKFHFLYFPTIYFAHIFFQSLIMYISVGKPKGQFNISPR